MKKMIFFYEVFHNDRNHILLDGGKDQNNEQSDKINEVKFNHERIMINLINIIVSNLSVN